MKRQGGSNRLNRINEDLRYARVYVSILNSRNTKQTLAGLKSSSGFIRSRIAEKINLRVTPELVFELDDSMQYGEKIDTILKDIMKDIKPEEQN